VSIGAINSAIIAGNGPEKRLQNLEAFWSTISGRKIWAYTPEGDIFRDFRNQTSSLMMLLFGQPGVLPATIAQSMAASPRRAGRNQLL
jgi:NTE family protein